jgi:hypothetical protein
VFGEEMGFLWSATPTDASELPVAKKPPAANCPSVSSNPYNMTHEQVMTSIERMGKHGIPEFSSN